MNIENNNQIVHLYPNDFTAKDLVIPLLRPSIIWLHMNMSIPDFLRSNLWDALYKKIVPGEIKYAIITEMEDTNMMSLKNIQFRQ